MMEQVIARNIAWQALRDYCKTARHTSWFITLNHQPERAAER